MPLNIYAYKTLQHASTAEFKDRGSKFLGFAFSIENIENAKNELKKIKELHPKANHFCFAYRIGFSKNIYRASDDGEPSGSAGKPILGQIDSAELTNVLIVVVRYFGGSLLGVAGLINAYKITAKFAIESNTIIEKNREETYFLEFDYTIVNEVMCVLKELDARYKMQDGGLFCQMIVKIALKNHAVANELLKDIRTLQYKIIIDEKD